MIEIITSTLQTLHGPNKLFVEQ